MATVSFTHWPLCMRRSKVGCPVAGWSVLFNFQVCSRLSLNGQMQRMYLTVLLLSHEFGYSRSNRGLTATEEAVEPFCSVARQTAGRPAIPILLFSFKNILWPTYLLFRAWENHLNTQVWSGLEKYLRWGWRDDMNRYSGGEVFRITELLCYPNIMFLFICFRGEIKIHIV